MLLYVLSETQILSLPFLFYVLPARLMRASTLFSTIVGGGGEAAFTSCIGHRWRKTKEQKPWNNTKHIFPWTENKEVFCFTSSGHLCPVHEVLTEKPKFVGCKIRGMRSWLVFLLFGVFTPLQWRNWTRDFDFYVLDVCICLWKYSSMSRSKAF